MDFIVDAIAIGFFVLMGGRRSAASYGRFMLRHWYMRSMR
jgi:hypothetical protein